MRISNFDQDGRCHRIVDDRYAVTFNGHEIPIARILYCDTQTGMMVTIKCSEHGVPVYRDGDTVTVIERGAVVITERSNVVIERPKEVAFE